MGYLIIGGFIIPDLTQEEQLESGALYVEGEKIVEVDSVAAMQEKYPEAEQIGGKDFLVIPGLVDAHQHARGISYPRRGAGDGELEAWISHSRGFKAVPTYENTMYSAMQQLQHGVTCTLHSNSSAPAKYEQDIYDALRAYQDLGMRVAFAMDMKDRNNYVYMDDETFLASLPSPLQEKTRELFPPISLSLAEYEAIFAQLQKKSNSTTKFLLGPYAVQWCSDELFQYVSKLAAKYHVGIHMHLMETKYQAAYAKKIYGCSAVEHLHSLGFWNDHVSCAHSIWISSSDINIMAENGVIAVHNPSSNLRLRSGIAAIPEMLDKSVRVAMGMDSLSMNDENDIFQDMRLCKMLHNRPGYKTRRPSISEIFKMTTVTGAETCQFGGEIGILEPERRADIVLLSLPELTSPILDERLSMRDNVFYSALGKYVDTVIVDGKILIHNKKFLTVDREAILKELKIAGSKKVDPQLAERRRVAKELTREIIRFYEEQE